jgi:uncharacterized membrane protein YjjB (DUF3815 family)
MITILIQFLLAMVATITFAILFCAPRRELLLCSLSGAISWIFYYLVYEQTKNPVLGSLAATFILTVYSRAVAVLRQCPATTYLLTGIFPLVPGAGIYYTAYYMITEQSGLFSAKGLETLEIALSIVFGIIFGFAIPQALFLRLGQADRTRQ